LVLDGVGEEVMRQHKLFRWDLRADQIDRMGLYGELGFAAPPKHPFQLLENIEPATELMLLDLWDIGRVLNLICADIAFDLPQDWFLQQANLDWIYSPIMDQYIPS